MEPHATHRRCKIPHPLQNCQDMQNSRFWAAEFNAVDAKRLSAASPRELGSASEEHGQAVTRKNATPQTRAHSTRST